MNDKRLLISLSNALECMVILARETEDQGVSELARKLHLSKSTVHTMLSTLEHKGFAEQDPSTGKYRIGAVAFDVGNSYVDKTELLEIASPYMEALAKKSEENVNLVLLSNSRDIVRLKYIVSPKDLQIAMRPGVKWYFHASAVGKVFLAYMPWEEASSLVERDGLPRLTPNTITSTDLLKAELVRIKESGYSVDNEEIVTGLRCLAAPIMDHRGEVNAAISVTGLAYHMTDKRLSEVATMVKDTARQISTRLGYPRL